MAVELRTALGGDTIHSCSVRMKKIPTFSLSTTPRLCLCRVVILESLTTIVWSLASTSPLLERQEHTCHPWHAVWNVRGAHCADSSSCSSRRSLSLVCSASATIYNYVCVYGRVSGYIDHTHTHTHTQGHIRTYSDTK